MDDEFDYDDPYAEEDPNAENEDEANPQQVESELTKEYDLPDGVVEAPPLDSIGELAVADVYSSLVALQAQVADSSRVDSLREYLREHPELSVAFFQVLHECGLAKLVGEETEEDELNAALGIESEDAMMEIPTTEVPPLPPGATTWLGKPRQRPGGQ